MRLFVFFVLLCVFIVHAAFLRNKLMIMMIRRHSENSLPLQSTFNRDYWFTHY